MKTIEVSVSSINGGDFARGYCGATFTVLTYAALNPAAGVAIGANPWAAGFLAVSAGVCVAYFGIG